MADDSERIEAELSYFVVLASVYPTEERAREVSLQAQQSGTAPSPLGRYAGLWAMPTPDAPIVHLFTDADTAEMESRGWSRKDAAPALAQGDGRAWIAQRMREVAGPVVQMLMWMGPTGRTWIAPLGSETPTDDAAPPPAWMPIRYEQRTDLI